MVRSASWSARSCHQTVNFSISVATYGTVLTCRISPCILALCEKVTAKRPHTVIDHILKHGYVTTEELRTLYGYDHPPRAARDVRENGVPLETYRIKSEQTGRRIGAYRFADPNEIRRGRIGGRRAFSKTFRDALIERYDSREAITGEQMDARYLQIDHRVPYEVAGEDVHNEKNLEEYMLLDASSQRAKSWSCEQCHNWQEKRDVAVCRSVSGLLLRTTHTFRKNKYVVWTLSGGEPR